MSLQASPSLNPDCIAYVVDYLAYTLEPADEVLKSRTNARKASRAEGQRLSLVSKDWLDAGRRLAFKQVQLADLTLLLCAPRTVASYVGEIILRKAPVSGIHEPTLTAAFAKFSGLRSLEAGTIDPLTAILPILLTALTLSVTCPSSSFTKWLSNARNLVSHSLTFARQSDL
ncbi:hypothetical protein JCM11641_001085 [Rhodosporidiobolus odoratus]